MIIMNDDFCKRCDDTAAAMKFLAFSGELEPLTPSSRRCLEELEQLQLDFGFRFKAKLDRNALFSTSYILNDVHHNLHEKDVWLPDFTKLISNSVGEAEDIHEWGAYHCCDILALCGHFNNEPDTLIQDFVDIHYSMFAELLDRISASSSRCSEISCAV